MKLCDVFQSMELLARLCVRPLFLKSMSSEKVTRSFYTKNHHLALSLYSSGVKTAMPQASRSLRAQLVGLRV